jgi:hypothetical protein
MAKKVGSDSPDPKMTTPGATVLSDNAVVTEGSFLTAVKEITQATLKVKLANEDRKAIRKKWKASGIVLGPLDTMVKMAEWNRGEVRDHFSVEKQYASWLGLPVEGRQTDAFKGLSDDQIQAKEWNAAGRTASRTGKPARPPEECPEEFHQAFMRGYNDEDEAAWGESETQDAKEPPPAAPEASVGAQPPPAQNDLPEHGWKGFADDPEDWLDSQWADFRAWYESLPAGAVLTIDHVGAKAAFQVLLKEERDALEPDDAGADLPRLADDLAGPSAATLDETPDERRNRIFNEGVQACRDNTPREPGPDYGEDDMKLWLDGWEHQCGKEQADLAAKGGDIKPGRGKGKGLH